MFEKGKGYALHLSCTPRGGGARDGGRFRRDGIRRRGHAHFGSARACQSGGLLRARHQRGRTRAAHVAGGTHQGPRPSHRDGSRQRAADREYRLRAGVHPGRRHRQGRQAGPRADRELHAARELGPSADRLLLRRAGTLGGARQGGSGEVLQRRRGDAVAVGAAGDGRTAIRGEARSHAAGGR